MTGGGGLVAAAPGTRCEVTKRRSALMRFMTKSKRSSLFEVK